ncbi:tRNA pseudouridine(13) synthase TruD [uncultured Ferrimonas sp.]|uniref:tRNA pseudouridine(13) synthase TruD n=1 Tax=uncultured Ferrimonas sp. TaxID=432640 RepID=UPI002632E427|nr:tRNA pseudouridine(13) synthase TruD [uncultured Ferrimonas sp.]
MTDYTLPQWHYLYGKPSAKGQIRAEASHFQVDEILPFAPDGEGENHMVHVEKTGLTTHQVADMLAKFAGVPSRDVSWAGLKDKHGITRQWLSIRIPGKLEPKWEALNSEQLTILASGRNLKKLRTGALLGNRFKIAISSIDNIDAVLPRLAQLQAGVPNYYGEQRFGHGGRNVYRAAEMFAGKRVKDRNKRSIYLSAARSFLFNHVLSARLQQHGSAVMAGDAMMLAGSNSFFVAPQWDAELQDRLARQDINLSAPLWGDGGGGAEGDAAEFEAGIVAPWPELCSGLANARMNPERRRALLIPEQLKYQQQGDLLWLEFILPSGAFATSVLRELVEYSDAQALPQDQAQGNP